MALDRHDLSRGAGGDTVREDLTDGLYMIDRTETPLISMISRGTAKQTLHEWQIERLNAPQFNAFPDGSDFNVLLYSNDGADTTADAGGADGGQNPVPATGANPWTEGTGRWDFDGDALIGNLGQAPGYNVPERIGVYCQISRKEVIITRRAEKVNKAGRRSELGRMRARRALELRRDMEMICLSNQPTRAGTSGNARTNVPLTAGVVAWIGSSRSGPQATTRYNTASMATANPSDDPILDGGSGTYGKPTVAVDETSPGAPTTAALSELVLLDTHAAVHEQGGKADVCMVPFLYKQRISQYLFSDASRAMAQNQDHGGNPGSVTVHGSVSYYETDYGKIKMVPNLWMRPTDILLLDKSKWKLVMLDGLKKESIGKRRDAYEEMFIVDWGLACLHEGANGIIRDVNTTVPMVAGGS